MRVLCLNVCAPLVLGLLASSVVAADFYVSPTGGNVSPFSTWDTAATNIQDAVEAAAAGDTVWVTNGVYASGMVWAGSSTNRVVLDKALTVRSVNGPFVTVIQGAMDPNTGTNGPLAVRCAWLTNGASLIGFTLQGGATPAGQSGGGASCYSPSATIANCIIQGNVASTGGGAIGGTLINCAIFGNTAGKSSGGGTYRANLMNCTVVGNLGGGALYGNLTNCIIVQNPSGQTIGGILNWQNNSFVSYTCTTPLPGGAGNITNAPQLLADNIHLAASSPCLASGTNLTTGTDIDGQPWANPPSMGCYQWEPAPFVGMLSIAVQPGLTGLNINAVVAGQPPFTCWWNKDGLPVQNDSHYNLTSTTNLNVLNVGPGDAGFYQVIASNSFGMSTSAVFQAVLHFVSSSGGAIPPYLDWSGAATNIQDAIDAAAPGEVVLVTNGVYATGGKVKAGDLTNRVALDKALIVQSLNGAATTTIQGAWDPVTTNGPAAVRCAWIGNGATLNGFTLSGGATRITNLDLTLGSGGGAWGNSNAATVANCIIRGCSASIFGGGASQVNIWGSSVRGNSTTMYGTSAGGGGLYGCSAWNCAISGNTTVSSGGGAYSCNLRNCLLMGNRAASNGGGVYVGTLVNCTVTGNAANLGGVLPGIGGGVSAGTTVNPQVFVTNCIIYGNQCTSAAYPNASNYDIGNFSYCCTAPLPSGAGNVSANPQFMPDGVHLSSTSPCIAAGLAAVTTGTDIDGRPWANPPSIGCVQWSPLPGLAGPVQSALWGTPVSLNLWSGPTGEPPFAFLWLKDGAVLQDGSNYTGGQTTNLVISQFGPPDAGAYQLVVSNSFGMFTSAVYSVVLHCVDASNSTPSAPYSDWTSAAATIQDAIDAASTGDFVLVTNGVYSNGGSVMFGDLTNRIAVNKPVMVASVNGPAATIIQGAWDPASTNGPLAVRCAWLGSGASLYGFTLQGGATRNAGDTLNLQSGGGLWCFSTNNQVTSCVISNNTASGYGGGTYQGWLQRCFVLDNAASQGGGGYDSFLTSSFVSSNSAGMGGGAIYSTLLNCTVTENNAPLSHGGGIYGSTATNSIIYYNTAYGGALLFANDWDYQNGHPSNPKMGFDWTTASITGTTPSPQLADGIHLSATSPCRGAGNPLYASGTDIDGEPWASPPSIGCDEFYAADFTGPILLTSASVVAPDGLTPVLTWSFPTAQVTASGKISQVTWSFGDGTVLTNDFTLWIFYSWTNPGDYTLTFTAFNYDNPNGVSTNFNVTVAQPNPPLLYGPGLNGTNLSFSYASRLEANYVVERATNLAPPVTWTPIAEVNAVSTNVTFTDRSATNPAAFYRLRPK